MRFSGPLTALLALALATVPAAGAREPGWAPPVVLGPSIGGQGQIAAPAPGRVVASWEGPRDHEGYSDIIVRSLGSATGDAQGTLGPSGGQYRLVSDDAGRALVVWGGATARYSEKNGDAPFSPPGVVREDWSGWTPKAAYGLDGAAVVVVEGWSGGMHRLWAHFRAAGGSFGEAVQVVESEDYIGWYDVAMTAAGEAVVIVAPYDDGYELQAVIGDSGGFSQPEILHPRDHSFWPEDLALDTDAHGNTIVAWAVSAAEVNGMPRERVMAALRPTGQGFGAPSELGLTSGYPRLDLDVGAAGRALITFDHPESGETQLYEVDTRGASFDGPVAVPTGGARVAVGPAGHAILVAHDAIDGYRAFWSEGPGSWSPRRFVMCYREQGHWGYLADVAIDGMGNASILWDQGETGNWLLSRTRFSQPPDELTCDTSFVPPWAFNPPYYGGAPGPQEGLPGSEVLHSVRVPRRQRLSRDGRFRLWLGGVQRTRILIEGFVRLRGSRSRLYIESYRSRIQCPCGLTTLLQLKGEKTQEFARGFRRGGKARLLISATHPNGGISRRRVTVPLRRRRATRRPGGRPSGPRRSRGRRPGRPAASSARPVGRGSPRG